MKSAEKLFKLKQKEKELASEIDHLLTALKTETGELIVRILEKENLLGIDQYTLAGAISDIKTVIETDPEKQKEWKENGLKLLQKMKRSSSRRKKNDDKNQSHSILPIKEKRTHTNDDSKTKTN